MPGKFSIPPGSHRDGFNVGGFGNQFSRGFGQDLALDVLDTAIEAPSVANLDREFLGRDPTFFYKMEDTASGDLVAEIGTDLPVVSGGGLAYSEGCPLMGTDASILYDGTGYHQLADNSYGNVAQQDFAAHLIFKKTDTALATLIGKRDGVDAGFEIRNTGATDSLYGVVEDADGTVNGAISAAISTGTWVDVWIVFEYGVSAQFYVDGAASGSAASIVGVDASLSSAVNLAIGASQGGGQNYDSNIALVALYIGADAAWLTQATAAPVIAQQHRALTGFRPQISAAGRDTAPVTFARNSNATLEKYNETTGAVELYTVGPHWMRVERWLDDSGNVVMGYRPELAGTNEWDNNTTISADWTAGDVTLAAGATIAGLPSCRVSENGDTDEHFIYNNSITFTATDWCASFIVKPDTRSVYAFYVYGAGGSTWANFNTSTELLGNNSATVNDGGVVDIGDGAFLCWCTWSGATESRSPRIHVRDADTNSDPSGDAYAGNSSAAGDVTAPQCELGTYPSSLIITAAAAATRAKDEVELDITGAGVGAQGAIVCDAVMRGTPPSSTYLCEPSDGSSNNRAVLYVGASTDVAGELTSGGANNSILAGSSTITDSAVHRFGGTWKTDRNELWVDGVIEGSDTSVVAPAAALTQMSVGERWNNDLQPSIPTLIRRIRIYRRFQHDMATLTGGVS